MSNFPVRTITKNPSVNLVRSLKFYQSRGFIDHRKHFEPEDQKWQWEVRKDPTIYYPNPCITKTCPKKTFFPKFRREYVSKDVKSCKRTEKPMSWKEYFSYLLPEGMQKPRPPVTSCKKMMEMKRRLCSDPRIPVCRQPPLPTEWEDQGVVKEVVSYYQPSLPTPHPKPCPPPPHILPRSLLVKKGICISKGKVPPCLEAYAVQFPNDELLKARKKAAAVAHRRPFVLKCNKTCYPKIPPVYDKTSRLLCRHYAEFKRVECPKQLYTRYKSVDVPKPPCTCVGASVPELKPVAASCCPRRLIHTGPSRTDYQTWAYSQPSKPPIEVGKFRRPYKNVVEPPWRTESYRNRDRVLSIETACPRISTALGREVKSTIGESKKPSQPRRVLDLMMDSFSKFLGRPETRSRTSGRREISTGVPLTSDDRCGKKDKGNKEEQICSGCAGVKAAEEEDPDRWVPPINCKMRAAGKCPGPKKQRGPDDAPISNPYWDNKGVYLSPCNQPREPECPKPPSPPMPCDENKQKRKYHTSAVAISIIENKSERY